VKRSLRSGLAATVLRLLLLVAISVTAGLVDSPRITRAFVPILVLAFAWGVLLLLAARRGRRRDSVGRLEPVIDVAFLCALALASGGPRSQVREAFVVVPLIAALSLGPRDTAFAGFLALAGFLVLWLGQPGAGEPSSASMVIEAIFLACAAAGATVMASLLGGGARQILQLARERGRLIAQTLDAQQLERKRLAYRLHDHPVQNVLAAKNQLAALTTEDNDRRATALAALELALTQLRETIFELQPLTLEQAGLHPTITQLAKHHATRTNIAIELFLDPEAAGAHDQLIYEVTRELLANAVAHANATQIEVTIERHDGKLTVEVADNGVGISDGRLQEALDEGHIGLAATGDRVRVLDGTLTVDTGPQSGTIVRAVIPARRSDDRRPREIGRRRADERRRVSTSESAAIPAWPPVDALSRPAVARRQLRPHTAAAFSLTGPDRPASQPGS